MSVSRRLGNRYRPYLVERPTLSTLDSHWHYLMSSGLAKSIHLSYSSGQRLFIDFCLDFVMLNADDSFLPPSEIILSRFICYLSSRGYKPSTIKGYLSAVRSFHVFEGFSNPLENKPGIQLVVRGLKRLKGSHRWLRCPITPSLCFYFVNT